MVTIATNLKEKGYQHDTLNKPEELSVQLKLFN